MVGGDIDQQGQELRTITPAMSRGKRVGFAVLIVMLCIAGGFGGAWLAVSIHPGTEESQGSTIDSMVTSDGGTVVTTDEELIASVAERVSVSVVSIITSTTRGYGAQGAGTGVIISKDGYVMTNNHVIDDARSVSIVLADGTRHSSVRVVGSDPLNDIAFLKIPNVTDLTPAKLGDSSKVRIGQHVVAIGNALGQFQNTVTSGIISATGRPLPQLTREIQVVRWLIYLVALSVLIRRWRMMQMELGLLFQSTPLVVLLKVYWRRVVLNTRI
jgi:S1-C subfamily serine protease